MKPKLWWISWWSDIAHRDSTELDMHVLGWWCTGTRCADDKYSICAYIEAVTEDAAKLHVAALWEDSQLPEFRFCEEKEVYEESSRFPELPWMTERLGKWKAVDSGRCRELLKSLLEWIDHGLPSPPNHTCGPQSPCDCACEHWANFSAFLEECRKEVKGG